MSANDRVVSFVRCFSMVLVLLLGGCATFPQQGTRAIGTLRTSGSQVFVNKQPASSGTNIYFGDEVTTGNNSGAIVDFRQGGSLQLDEDTDPVITYWEQARCILIRVFGGQVSVNGEGICVEAPPLRFALNSEVNLQVFPQHSVITVLQGTATLSWPEQLDLTRSQQATLSARGIEGDLRTLSERELRAVVQWRTKFIFPDRVTSVTPPETGGSMQPIFNFMIHSLPIVGHPGSRPAPNPESPSPRPPKPSSGDGVRSPGSSTAPTAPSQQAPVGQPPSGVIQRPDRGGAEALKPVRPSLPTARTITGYSMSFMEHVRISVCFQEITLVAGIGLLRSILRVGARQDGGDHDGGSSCPGKMSLCRHEASPPYNPKHRPANLRIR